MFCRFIKRRFNKIEIPFYHISDQIRQTSDFRTIVYFWCNRLQRRNKNIFNPLFINKV